ncbi:YdhK family protein [Nicoliella spurrieriana]|uniref:YdhK family protein n=1 Tax=Nicoliella spurrieriana TaxID=2925830 RepID=A0A976RT34_9LACO|nr:YdhK family protein [Nicoliella spurrieriana]UQS87341.1 YdhK family protein [Nicoliella spurrieriana]
MKNMKIVAGLTAAAVAALLIVPVGVNAMSSHSSAKTSSSTSMKDMSSSSSMHKMMDMSSSSSMHKMMDMSSSSSMHKMGSASGMSHMKMGSMMMKANGGKAPKGLKMDPNAKYQRGSKVKILASHMPGMKGATATVTGAYKTDLYTIDFTPTNGGKEVKNHKYVVAKEVKAANKGQLKVGTKITVKADHMTGMKGAKGKIVAVKKGPAYMVNFKATNSSMVYKNHKWLAQSDLTSIK